MPFPPPPCPLPLPPRLRRPRPRRRPPWPWEDVSMRLLVTLISFLALGCSVLSWDPICAVELSGRLGSRRVGIVAASSAARRAGCGPAKRPHGPARSRALAPTIAWSAGPPDGVLGGWAVASRSVARSPKLNDFSLGPGFVRCVCRVCRRASAPTSRAVPLAPCANPGFRDPPEPPTRGPCLRSGSGCRGFAAAKGDSRDPKLNRAGGGVKPLRDLPRKRVEPRRSGRDAPPGGRPGDGNGSARDRRPCSATSGPASTRS